LNQATKITFKRLWSYQGPSILRLGKMERNTGA